MKHIVYKDSQRNKKVGKENIENCIKKSTQQVEKKVEKKPQRVCSYILTSLSQWNFSML